MSTHAAKAENSDRLQRVLRYLADGLWHSTRDVIEGARVCAVNSVMDELRDNGYNIECRRTRPAYYRLLREPVQLEIAA